MKKGCAVIILGGLLLVVCVTLINRSSRQSVQTEKHQPVNFRSVALQTVSYLNDIAEVSKIYIDPSDNSTLFVEFNKLPPDFEAIIRAGAIHLSRKKNESTGASGILVYGTRGGTDFEHAFWFVQARYGTIQESRRW